MGSNSKKLTVIGWILTVIPSLLMIASGVGKIVGGKGMEEGFAHLGWPIERAHLLAILEIGSVILFLIPQTCVIGAILLTGYMGGAIATHLRIGEPVYIHIPLTMLFWFALFLRLPKLRTLIPLVCCDRKAATPTDKSV